MTPMRFEVRAAYVVGWGLPLAEAARRRTNFTPVVPYIDDFIIGALLLLAARAVTRNQPHGPGLLVAAWGALCGGLFYSVFGQIEQGDEPDISGLPNPAVIAIKAGLYVVALVACWRSVRALGNGPAGDA